jgi:hypothetical protein
MIEKAIAIAPVEIKNNATLMGDLVDSSLNEYRIVAAKIIKAI